MATPIYLAPDSRFPSGHHPRSWLESKTRGVQTQRWFRVVTKDKAYGWLAEDHLITTLKLTDQAELVRDTPARTERRLDAILGRPVLKKKTQVLILEIVGSWARVQSLKESDPQNAWVPTEDMKALISESGPQRAYLPHTVAIRVQPDVRARALTRVPEGSYVHLISIKKDWLEVRTASAFGFIARNEAVLAVDLGEKGAHPAIALAPLRSAPLPYADLLRSLPRTQALKVVDEKSLRWGEVTIRDSGKFWWPIADDTEDEPAKKNATPVTIATSELFQRKIYDMAASKAIPSLKFASADGIYRTVDGEEWKKIPLFSDQNYPISVASTGAVFIGPYVSEDHGETFQQWIRWDALVSALSPDDGKPDDGKKLGILEIKPQDSAGRRVKLKLDLGRGKSMQVVTDDQGLSWRTL
ncbi:MAG: hypothetical protein V4760_06430 [Bdellovibrionota bacterium]